MRKSMSVAHMPKFQQETQELDWMRTFKPMKAMDKMELPYFDESFRLFVNVKRDFRT